MRLTTGTVLHSDVIDGDVAFVLLLRRASSHRLKNQQLCFLFENHFKTPPVLVTSVPIV